MANTPGSRRMESSISSVTAALYASSCAGSNLELRHAHVGGGRSGRHLRLGAQHDRHRFEHGTAAQDRLHIACELLEMLRLHVGAVGGDVGIDLEHAHASWVRLFNCGMEGEHTGFQCDAWLRCSLGRPPGARARQPGSLRARPSARSGVEGCCADAPKHSAQTVVASMKVRLRVMVAGPAIDVRMILQTRVEPIDRSRRCLA